MHPDIRSFPSFHFYGGKLIDADYLNNLHSVSDIDKMPSRSKNVNTRAASNLVDALSIRSYRLRRVENKSVANLSESKSSIEENNSKSRHCSISFYKHNDDSVFLRAIEFFDIVSSREEHDRENRKTFVNIQEALFIGNLCKLMDNCFSGYSVGIITPYDGQKRLIKKVFYDNKVNFNRAIEVNTVDGINLVDFSIRN
jgi:superfamily I DNA and/or RNA helicase